MELFAAWLAKAVAMRVPRAAAGPDTSPGGRRNVRGRLLFKYVAFFAAVVCLALASSTAFDSWFYYRLYQTALTDIQRAQAVSAADKINQFRNAIESQIGWTTQRPWDAAALDAFRFDAVRLLRQEPAVTELAVLDSSGRERLRLSRRRPETTDGAVDRSRDPAFTGAMANKVYYGPVVFGDSEPHLTLAMAGAGSVSVADVDLQFVSQALLQAKAGSPSQIYVVDAQGHLIAHTDAKPTASTVDLSRLAQVQSALTAAPQPDTAVDLEGRPVLSAHASVSPLGWFVFVELPMEQVRAPLAVLYLRTGLHLLVALILAILAGFLLARRMVGPIQALRLSAARVGSGDLAERVAIKTGDELEMLGNQFNRMAGQLQDSYATLERKVEARTRQLELANVAKSRFLAAASHDLRQPLHALGLFAAQLRGHIGTPQGQRIVEQTNDAVANMSELFDALLDISKLDANVLTPEPSEFPIDRLLTRIKTTFAAAAREKGLSLRVVPSNAFVRSDPVLLERILLNIVSNAIRYTTDGGIVIGCRRRDGLLRLEVCDTGIGIPADQQQNVFSEFYQLPGPQREARAGMGLGLAIVERLCRLLDHPIELHSKVGQGSRFVIVVPAAVAPASVAQPDAIRTAIVDTLAGQHILVIDDQSLVRDSMSGLLQSWGCRVTVAASEDTALEALGDPPKKLDLIVSDYRLLNGKTGFEAIDRIRVACGAPIPAFLISGDTTPERLREAQASGFRLLHKPVHPMKLRAMVSQALKQAP